MNNLATLRVPSIGGLENIKFFEAVLEIIQAGNFKLKSLVLPEKLEGHLLSTLDNALAAHTDSLRCFGLSFDDHSLTFSRDRWDRLGRFATRYSVFAISGSSDIQLYPVFDASSPMWNSELYVQDVHRATHTRGDSKGPHLTVTFLRQCYSVVPRLLRYLATSFPVIKAFTFTLLYEAPLNYASDADRFPALEAIIDALASFECQVTALAFAIRCGDLDLELTWEEVSMLLRLIGSRCNSVQEVTLPDATKYRRDPNTEEGWSREYIADADTDWERDNRFYNLHYGSDDTDSDPYEGYEFYWRD
ncbi:hypothetical protein EXIGLDRAFT_763371 [Exidia glandulosa HHB12029]|uniref:Uncharacterized protein n=1 Tax=Exidia glandulosa HHB12029 TaxID=1314781 RepID=A0A165M372_EXIGL|nr:hypothetical protein EXIGLDRAFT_763371 [Exidia glandulosa HHB12029]